MMPSLHCPLKAIVLSALIAAGGQVFAQKEDNWYGGYSSGFWGLGDSVGVRGTLPAVFGLPSSSAEGLSASRFFSGYRMSDSFAIEGAQTSFGLSGSACGGDPLAGDAYRSCYGSAWSLSGVATRPIRSIGLALYGRMGMHYWQNGPQDEGASHRTLDDLGKVYGIGLSYEFTKAVTFRAEAERYTDLAGTNGNGPATGVGLDANVHSIGLSIKF
ncbi:MAG: hypothetical protein ACT4PQ_07480 [Betaproteobacteria bacterium]